MHIVGLGNRTFVGGMVIVLREVSVIDMAQASLCPTRLKLRIESFCILSTDDKIVMHYIVLSRLETKIFFVYYFVSFVKLRKQRRNNKHVFRISKGGKRKNQTEQRRKKETIYTYKVLEQCLLWHSGCFLRNSLSFQCLLFSVNINLILQISNKILCMATALAIFLYIYIYILVKFLSCPIFLGFFSRILCIVMSLRSFVCGHASQVQYLFLNSQVSLSLYNA